MCPLRRQTHRESHRSPIHPQQIPHNHHCALVSWKAENRMLEPRAAFTAGRRLALPALDGLERQADKVRPECALWEICSSATSSHRHLTGRIFRRAFIPDKRFAECVDIPFPEVTEVLHL